MDIERIPIGCTLSVRARSLRATLVGECWPVNRQEVKFGFGAPRCYSCQLQQDDKRRHGHAKNALHAAASMRDRCQPTIGQNP
jgi:hypothetical protein